MSRWGVFLGVGSVWAGIGLGDVLSIDCTFFGRIGVECGWGEGGFSGPKLRFGLGCEIVGSLMRDLRVSIGLCLKFGGYGPTHGLHKNFESPNSKS